MGYKANPYKKVISSFNKVTDPPPEKKTEMNEEIINRAPGNFAWDEIEYSVDAALLEQNEQKNKEWQESEKREELWLKNDMKENPEKYAEAVKEFHMVTGVAPTPGGVRIKSLLKGGRTLINFVKQWIKGGPKSATQVYNKLPSSNITHYGKFRTSADDVAEYNKRIDFANKEEVFNIIKERGMNWDAKKFIPHRSMIREVQGFGKPGTPGYRRVMEFNPGDNLGKQRYWQSSGGGKKFMQDDAGNFILDKSGSKISTRGNWYPFEGKGNIRNYDRTGLRTGTGKPGYYTIKDWAMKNTDGPRKFHYDRGYGSQTIKDVSEILRKFDPNPQNFNLLTPKADIKLPAKDIIKNLKNKRSNDLSLPSDRL